MNRTVLRSISLIVAAGVIEGTFTVATVRTHACTSDGTCDALGPGQPTAQVTGSFRATSGSPQFEDV